MIVLPVWQLTRPEIDRDRLSEIADEVFDLHGDLVDDDDRITLSDDRSIVEVFTASGGMFAADRTSLHNPMLEPTLPEPDRVEELARSLVDRYGLLPPLADGFELSASPGATYVATRSRRSADRRVERQLDVQARYALTVGNPGVEGEVDLLPIVGGGGKLSLTFGENGRLIAIHGGIRQIGERHDIEALDKKEAFDQLGADGEFDPADAYLAYYLAPGDVAQELLTPVWVFRSRFDVDHSDGRGGSTVHARHTWIAATTHGPVLPKLEPQADRAQLAKVQVNGAARAANPSEAGTSWVKQIDQTLPLNGSPQNAQGFVDGLQSDGWQVNFNWGDQNAWESDWNASDDSWVDAADFVFYTGHANQNGWVLCTPGQKKSVLLTPSVVGSVPQTPGDRYGQNDLEWVTIAACGPLQDELLARGGGDVLGRWDGAFDGLHTLLGYGAITFDNTDEGRKLSRYTRDGMSIIDAWFRTAKEVQPATNGESAPDGPTVWVGAMWVTKPGADPSGDRIWGHGQVSADPTAPATLVCMWTTC